MKKYVLIVAFSITFILHISCDEKAITREVLFDKNVNDWFSEGDAEWKFANGELSGSLESGSGFVMTKKSYKDFVLELEFKPDSAINSGIFIRCKEKKISNVDCYEINIWDLHPDQKNRTGALVTRSPPLAIIETINQWSRYKIKNENDHLQVWINDTLMIDLKNQELMEGPIALQAAGSGEITFRKIRISTNDRNP